MKKRQSIFFKIFNKDIFSILGNIATLSMAVVAIFGYFYTVKPAFQLNEAEKTIKTLKTKEEKLIIINNKLDDDIKIKEQNIIKLHDNENNLILQNQELTKKQQEYKNDILQIAKKNKDIEKKHINLYIEEWRGKKNNEFMFSVIEFSEDSIFIENNIDGIINKLKNKYVNPIKKAEDELDKLETIYKNHSASIEKKSLEKLIQMYKKNLIKYKDILECKEPDYQQWKKNYILSLDNNHTTLVNQCIKYEEKLLIDLNKWDEKKIQAMKETDFWAKQLKDNTVMCQKEVKKLIGRSYLYKWNKYVDLCDFKVMNMINIILEKQEKGILEKITNDSKEISILPPQKSEIDHLIEKNF